jgi:hypothetical protein
VSLAQAAPPERAHAERERSAQRESGRFAGEAEQAARERDHPPGHWGPTVATVPLAMQVVRPALTNAAQAAA